MKRLLIQSDDFGFTYGVTDGTVHAIKHGVVKNTGMFVNMPSSAYAAERIKECPGVCLGIDINLAAGFPVSDPKDVPHLLRADGRFKSSVEIRKENKLIRNDSYIYYFEEDPYNYDEVLLETENQVKRFIELNGKLPEYLNAHSIMTENTEKAAMEIRRKYGIKGHSSDLYFHPDFALDLATAETPYDYQPMSVEEQIRRDYSEQVKRFLPLLPEDRISLYVCHCGFIDKDLFANTTLTVQRMNDVALVTNPEIKKALEENGIQLVTYRDIY